MPKVRVSELSTAETAVFDTDSGELVILPESAKAEWQSLDGTIEEAKKLADSKGGYVITKRQLKTLLLATDSAVLLT